MDKDEDKLLTKEDNEVLLDMGWNSISEYNAELKNRMKNMLTKIVAIAENEHLQDIQAAKKLREYRDEMDSLFHSLNGHAMPAEMEDSLVNNVVDNTIYLMYQVKGAENKAYLKRVVDALSGALDGVANV